MGKNGTVSREKRYCFVVRTIPLLGLFNSPVFGTVKPIDRNLSRAAFADSGVLNPPHFEQPFDVRDDRLPILRSAVGDALDGRPAHSVRVGVISQHDEDELRA